MTFHVSYHCYDEDRTLGFTVAVFAIGLPSIVWWGVNSAWVWQREVIFVVLTANWGLTYMLWFLLAETFQLPSPCQLQLQQEGVYIADRGYGFPAFEPMLFTDFVAFIWTFNHIRGKHTKTLNYVRGISLYLLCVGGLWWTGNYDAAQVFAGVLFGIVIGTSYAFCLQNMWLANLMLLVRESKLGKKLGYYDTIISPPEDGEIPEGKKEDNGAFMSSIGDSIDLTVLEPRTSKRSRTGKKKRKNDKHSSVFADILCIG